MAFLRRWGRYSDRGTYCAEKYRKLVDQFKIGGVDVTEGKLL